VRSEVGIVQLKIVIYEMLQQVDKGPLNSIIKSETYLLSHENTEYVGIICKILQERECSLITNFKLYKNFR
jgi:hypothetical protein